MRFWSFIVCGILLGGIACVADEEAQERHLTAAELPQVATSSDHFVRVVASDVPSDPVGFRLPILRWTMRILGDVARVYRLEMPRGDSGLVIYAHSGQTNDTRVITSVVRKAGGVVTRIHLPSPGYSDMDQLRFEVVKAYLRSWVARSGKADSDKFVGCKTIPDWLVMGTLRGLNPNNLDNDKHAILLGWSSAHLLSLSEFCKSLLVADKLNVAGCGYVVAWLKERKQYKYVLEQCAVDNGVSAEDLAFLLTDERDWVRQDQVADERLVRLSRSVLTPGKASSWDLRVFVSRLDLYASEFDGVMIGGKSVCSFRDAIEVANDNFMIRQAAWLKAREIPFYAMGRGNELVETAEAYRDFLNGLAQGDETSKLVALLDVADTQMEELLNEDGKNHNR